MMKIGIETETCHLLFQNKRIDIFGFIEQAAAYGYDGVMINLIEKKNQTEGLGAAGKDDKEHLLKVRDALRMHNLFLEVDARGTDYAHLAHILEVADLLGADLVRTFVMSGGGYTYGALGGSYNEEGFKRAVEELRRVVPLLKKHRIRLAIENHELETMDDMLWLVEQIDSPWVGVHLDVANCMNAWESPVDATKKAAKRAFTTHLKDCLVCPNGAGDYVISGAPLGKGSVDLEECCRILFAESTLTRFIIELSHPYSGPFQRAEGAGGSKLGEGAFVVKEPPYPLEIVKPRDYYLYDGELLEQMIEEQRQTFREAGNYLRAICNKIEAEYN